MQGTLHAQAKKNTYQREDSTSAVLQFLAGSWISDTAKSSIEFTTDHYEIRLTVHNGYSYEFLRPTGFPLTGVSITWPPHDCLVKKIDPDHLEIQYTIFGSKPFAIRYKRASRTL